MTPGEAAVMKASVGAAAVTAARKLAVSLPTAVRSFQSMGPSHVGALDGRAPLGARGGFREVGPVGSHAGQAAPAEAGEAVSDVGGVADLALLAVADDVDTGVALGPDDVGHRLAYARLEGARIGHAAGVQRLQERGEIVGAGQAAGVRREDAVCAGFHGAVR